MKYVIRKSGSGKRPWNLSTEQPGWFTHLSSFAKRREAVTVARLLAGRRGKVVVL